MALAHAKITRPLLPQVLPRARLFDKLDKALTRPLTWIFAPAGAGKTTLVASYLDARGHPATWYRIDERDRDIPTFLNFLGMAIAPRHDAIFSAAPFDGTLPPRTWLEQCFAQLPPGAVIVFEDYDEAAEAPLFEELFVQAVLALPPGIAMVVTSRQGPPARFASFKAKQQLTEFRWRELQFNTEETAGVLALHGGTWPGEAVAAIQKEIDGWPAGVALLSLYGDAGDDGFAAPARARDRKALFDYFAAEVFAHFSREDRVFMLKTAFLPTMTAELARHLSGERDSAGILARFHARGYFIERHGEHGEAYRYHPLFRAFLVQTALDVFPTRDVATLQHEAARQLEEEGAVDDAVEILGINGNWDVLVGMVQRNAARFIRSGRVETVRFWLGAIPRPVAETLPAWHYWQGCCAMTDAPAEAAAHFTRAFELAEVLDPALTLQAWSGIVNALLMMRDDFTALDVWIAWLENFIATQGGALPPETEGDVAMAMTWALTSRQPQHPDLNAWLNRTSRIFTRRGDRQRLLQARAIAADHYCWTGDMAELDIALTELRKLTGTGEDPGAFTLMGIWLEGVAGAWQEADAVRAQHKAAEGLALAEATGCHFLDHLFHALSAYGHLLARETRAAGAALDDMAGTLNARSRHAFSHYHYLQVWRALLDGDIHAAASNSTQAVRLAQQTGMVFAEILCRLAHARVLHETGDAGDARRELVTATALAKSSQSPLLQCMCSLLEALMAFDAGEMARFRTCAGQGFGTMHEQGYVTLFWWWLPDDMSKLCGAALEEGIETGFVMGLIRQHGLPPSLRTLRGERWPWLMRVYTLGRFNVIVEDRPLPFSGKSQARPLAMLQAIIARGGRGVGQEELIECLWPDADGDVGHQSFATTLHRLRKLVGHDQTILLQDGKVTLNPLYCWVDVWAFERVASRLLESQSVAKPDRNTMIRQAERVLALYHGPFLGEDTNHGWAISLRERLRSRLLRVIQHVGVLLEDESPEQAVLLYEKGIDTDPFIEEFYQGLMRCHARQGKKGDLHSAYRRCSTVLKAIAAAPSLGTDTLYRNLLAAT